MTMKVSLRGLAEIASHEGIVNAPYKDSVGVWTVGIGHTASAGPPDPAEKRGEYTMQDIMDIFARDVAKFEKRVNVAFTRTLSQREFDAAVSFDYNTGGIHRASWVRHFNDGNDAKARKAFMNWSKPPEIIPRRKKERDLFFDGTYSGNGMATLWPATSSGRVLWGRGHDVDVMRVLNGSQDATSKREPSPSVPLPGKAETPSAGKSGRNAGIVAAIILAAGAAWSWLAGLPCDVLNVMCG